MTHSVCPKRKPSPDALAAALAQLGVPFVTYDARIAGERLARQPAALLAGLAEQKDARLRISIIALLMRHPDFAAAMPAALRALAPRDRVLLKILYTAAVILQQKYAAPLGHFFGVLAPLPDLYSQELGIATHGDSETRLRRLADKHRAQTHLDLNWRGTYEHAAERFLKHEEKQRGWVERLQKTSKPS